MYKLISLDLDGTLFNSEGKISKRNMKCLKDCHDKNIQTVIATGRPPRYTFSHLPKVLTSEYCICYNGARIYKKGNLIYEKVIQKGVTKKIIEFVKSCCEVPKIAAEVNDQLFTNFDLCEYWPGIESRLRDLDEAEIDKACKLLVINSDCIPYDLLLEKFSCYCNILTTDNNRLIEIMDVSVSKLEAVKVVANELGVSIDEVIAFGDDSNDVEILSEVGKGVAMGNASKYVKGSACTITLTNDEDGVASVLEGIYDVGEYNDH